MSELENKNLQTSETEISEEQMASLLEILRKSTYSSTYFDANEIARITTSLKNKRDWVVRTLLNIYNLATILENSTHSEVELRTRTTINLEKEWEQFANRWKEVTKIN
jgi:hypothetical protein